MAALHPLSPETIALFERAEQATRESRRLLELIEMEHNRTFDKLQRMLEIGLDFSRRSKINYSSDTAEIRAKQRAEPQHFRSNARATNGS